MSVKWHGVTGLRVMGHGTDAGRTPPLTSPRACARWSLTDGTGTQGQAGGTRPSYGALYHSHTGNPRAGRGCAPVAVSLPLAVNLGTGRGFRHPLRFLLYMGLWEALRRYYGRMAARLFI